MAKIGVVFYTGAMKREEVTAEELATIAKACREASGKSRAQVALELGVGRQAVYYAEDCPERSMFKLRKRIIETYSSSKVEGPVFLIEQK